MLKYKCLLKYFLTHTHTHTHTHRERERERFQHTSSAKIGKNIVVVATLLVTSVNVAIITHKANTMAHGVMPSKFLKSSLMSADKPDI